MATPQPTLADLVFPSASTQPNLNTLLTDLKRANLSIRNRLRSILQDAEFVRQAHTALGGASEDDASNNLQDQFQGLKLDEPTQAPKKISRPLVANERCGSWYVRPEVKGASAYFKSTDGHDNAWKFSTRRLNLHLLDVIGKHDGCIIVDSTRRGKRMPDALSKTIPIWCAVLNRALFPSHTPGPRHALHTPPQVVSPSEHAQIAALLPKFLDAFYDLDLDPHALRSKISKPLRPFWVTPDSDLSAFEGSVIFEDYHPIVCCTASLRVAGGELTTMGSSARDGGSYVYVQGAGDDTENWACGLTAEIWWANVEKLLATEEAELPELIAELLRDSEARALEGNGDAVEATTVAPGVAVCTLAQLGAISGTDDFKISLLPTSGRDTSVAAALAISIWCFDNDGRYRTSNARTIFTKDMVKVRLGVIMTAFPAGNPGRASLQSVNSFLMDYRR
ncbi:initiator tRNA phosphoribosyl transferase [Plectosphaerella plurivora]|uniref:Initiator tRNA phosphoribosyl transferase n=1 Tax=Plectosphaerella plurivora TaxID=936078 RepID=A0A9P9AB91_9PEZI|nr:initiator tRNA phosphoribosyl transferase [Plectosphaerella plurivora]